MFAAKPHPLLVPFDGTFDVREAPTAPPRTKTRTIGRSVSRTRSRRSARRSIGSTPTGATPCCSCSRRSTPPARTARFARVRGRESAGFHVTSFKQPSRQELDHDFLWRTTRASARARQDRRLQSQLLRGGARRARASRVLGRSASRAAVDGVLGRALTSIAEHERHLARAGHRGPEVLAQRVEGEQRKRFLERIDDRRRTGSSIPATRRARAWDDYMEAYERRLSATCSPGRRGTPSRGRQDYMRGRSRSS